MKWAPNKSPSSICLGSGLRFQATKNSLYHSPGTTTDWRTHTPARSEPKSAKEENVRRLSDGARPPTRARLESHRTRWHRGCSAKLPRRLLRRPPPIFHKSLARARTGSMERFRNSRRSSRATLRRRAALSRRGRGRDRDRWPLRLAERQHRSSTPEPQLTLVLHRRLPLADEEHEGRTRQEAGAEARHANPQAKEDVRHPPRRPTRGSQVKGDGCSGHRE